MIFVFKLSALWFNQNSWRPVATNSDGYITGVKNSMKSKPPGTMIDTEKGRGNRITNLALKKSH